MNNLIKTFFILTLFVVGFYSCNVKKQKEIIVYGSSQCPHCVHFLEKLDSAKMVYDFRDFMQAEKNYDEEMLKKLEAINFREYISLPVAEVEGQFFVNAKFDEVKEAAFSTSE